MIGFSKGESAHHITPHLRWNVLDGFDPDSPVIVPREDFERLRKCCGQGCSRCRRDRYMDHDLTNRRFGI